jgi:lysylphosphatidylglycerol synthetase-like protein (DUF2156 family)
MPIVIASNFGDVAVAEWVETGLIVALIVSAVSLLLLLPKPLRKKGRWHGWIALAVSGGVLLASVYLLSTMRRRWEWDDLSWLGLLAVPTVLALLSLFFSRRKRAG